MAEQNERFGGITEYHDGLAVSDYVNMLPLGDSCVDRVGDLLLKGFSANDTSEVRGTFIDSEGTIYIAKGDGLFRIKYNRESCTLKGNLLPMQWYVGGARKRFGFLHTEGKVSFCESGIKPSVVFCCDGAYIYMWNTVSNPTGLAEREPHMVNMMYLPNMNYSTVPAALEYGSQPSFVDYAMGAENAPDFSGWRQKENMTLVQDICWFDNKLAACDKERSTVWLTRTDPMSYFRTAPGAGGNTPSYPLNPADGIDLWYNYYSSTNSADKLIDVASYAGSLYFFNDKSIEVWSRTGNEDSPIQPNTSRVIHFGGRSPMVFEGVLYFISMDTMGDEGIAAFTPELQRLSNKEIERRLGKPADLQIICQRKQSYLFVRNSDNSGFLFRNGRWSSWQNPEGTAYVVRNSIVQDIAVADNGNLLRFDENVRTTAGVRYNRYIRDGFQQFDRRVLFRRFHVIMDTGKTDSDLQSDEGMSSCEMYLSLSTNRGMSFSQRRYRKLGHSGHNNKTIEWVGLGSGNSILVEFGTSSLHRLQLYGMGLDIK